MLTEMTPKERVKVVMELKQPIGFLFSSYNLYAYVKSVEQENH